MKGLFKVLEKSAVTYMYEAEFENGKMAKCEIELEEFGGNGKGDQFIATLWDKMAEQRFNKGDLVVASLKFGIGQHIFRRDDKYQIVNVNDIMRL